jgi:hypothetical protein
MLLPTEGRPWAPQGQTPLHHSWDRHDRLSVIGAITISPLRKPVGLHFAMVPWTITADDGGTFVQQVQRHLKRPHPMG